MLAIPSSICFPLAAGAAESAGGKDCDGRQVPSDHRTVSGCLAIPTVTKTMAKPNINPICISNMARSSARQFESQRLDGEDILSDSRIEITWFGFRGGSDPGAVVGYIQPSGSRIDGGTGITVINRLF